MIFEDKIRMAGLLVSVAILIYVLIAMQITVTVNPSRMFVETTDEYDYSGILGISGLILVMVVLFKIIFPDKQKEKPVTEDQ